MFGIPFGWRKASKCKKLVRRAQCRLKFLKIKKCSIIKQLREDIVELLKNGKPETAFSHAEELVKDQSLLIAYDLLEHFCEFVILHLPYIRKQKNYSNDINEAVSTLIFAAAWCGDLPELQTIKKLFRERHGSKFIKAIAELHPGNHVNNQVKEKLRLKSIPDNMKLSVIVELAKEHAFKAEHQGCSKSLGSNLLLICGNDSFHWEGFIFEVMAQGDYGSSWLAEMLSTNDNKDMQAKLPGQVVEVGNSIKAERGYETEMVCDKLSCQGRLVSFGSNRPCTISFKNKVQTSRTSSHSDLLVQFNKVTFNLDEIEEIPINTLKDCYAGDKTIFLFKSTLLSERNNDGVSGANLLVSSHCYNDHYTGKTGLWIWRTWLPDSYRRKSLNSMMSTGISDLNEGRLCHSCLSPPHSSVKDINCELYNGESGNLSSYQKHKYHGTCPQIRHSRKVPSKDSFNQFQNSKGTDSSTYRHVHPKLPDYDELVAKFKALKQEHEQREAACYNAVKT